MQKPAPLMPDKSVRLGVLPLRGLLFTFQVLYQEHMLFLAEHWPNWVGATN